ncbi:UDP-N-acetylmuramoylalanine--D-glutamate ligase [Methanobrevibacter olleyae]|uniref:UDP-N-acetylmuramoylalanine--D-glutamate ligase n=1 Tax=Methanobrevibacter olleyae TaxID=294671 RepID=A0A1I4GKL4_METOL|nr:Mur ligase family protein [Methanobrevibacter olleyae]SFL29721.1 UDP-N-acetylmuramoylalanine--D-glutamate ligase [Methanobrevibacter olleyae]
MKAAVIGLGVEGKKALNSLLKYGWEVYATDLNVNINLDNLPISLSSVDISPQNDKISFVKDNLSIDLGFNNQEKIDSCDAVVLSPSIWGSKIAEHYKNSGKLLCDVKTKHRDIFTIGVTGTNGKTTTVSMIKEILENAGKNVLVGGNAGGGFEGYYDLILEADKQDYDFLLVEVCDMTVGFCNHCFDFDLIALTNMGNDHMNVHGSMEGYKNSLKEFFADKIIFINNNQEYKEEFRELSRLAIEYSKTDYDLDLFGKFNKLNAGLSEAITNFISENTFEIDEKIIKNTLENFKPVEGRLEVLKLNDCEIYIGKSDNSDAIKAILEEVDFAAVFIGTPRHNENHRLDILNEVVNANPEAIILFPGLEDTLDQAKFRLHALDYQGRIEIANNLDEIIGFVAEFSHNPSILIGGNGQENIIKIQDRLKEICDSFNHKENRLLFED